MFYEPRHLIASVGFSLMDSEDAVPLGESSPEVKLVPFVSLGVLVLLFPLVIL